MALAALTLAPPAALADTLEERLAAMEARMTQLEGQVARQADEIAARDARIAELTQRRATVGASGEGAAARQVEEITERDERIAGLPPQRATAGAASWAERVTVGGLIEIEAAHESPENSGDTSNIVAATVELAIGAKISDWIAAEIVAKYEEESDNDGDFNIDTAVVSIADPAGPWFVNAGQYTLPFGVFPSNMISDPLTLELAETLDSAIEVGMTQGMFTASGFAFKGDRQDDVSNFGLRAGLATEFDDVGVEAHLGYMNDLAESDAIVDAGWVAAGDGRVPAWIASTQVAFGNFTLMAEYLAATKGLASAGNDKPKAWTMEAAYAFNAMRRPATAALGLQRTRDMRDAKWGLPEKRVLGTVAIEVIEGAALGLELKRDTDYAGETTDTVTGQLAVEF